MRPCRLLLLALAATLALAGESPALPDPAKTADEALARPGLRNASGEQLTWNAAFYAHDFLNAFDVSRDPAWLEAAQKYYDAVVKLSVSDDPDGWPGTIGADISTKLEQEATVADTVVGDANVCWPLVQFATRVRSDPALAARFGKRADEYVALATRMCWEKWNKRGCYRQDGLGYGSYHTYEKAIDKADRTKWVPRAEIVSDNLNKHYKIGLVILELWKLTGKPEYRDRVIAIYSRAKAMFRLLPDENRVVWNFWMPHGPYDIEGTSPKSWVGVHPSRPGYQAFEVGAFLDVYDSGLVFDRSDMERIVATNRWMIANGLKSADGSSKAGQVWDALAGLDPAIRDAAVAAAKPGSIHAAHLAWAIANRTGYERMHVPAGAKVQVSDAPVQPGRKLIAALAVPETVELANDDRIRLLAEATGAGAVTVELLGADGKEVLGVLDREELDGKQGAFIAPRWDGLNPKTGKKEPGRFVVRWTYDGESRTWPVVVVQGTATAKREGPAPLAPGATLGYDFEQPLDARWTLVGGAALAGERKVQGAQALRVGFRQSARLRFGGQDDLPVRVAFAAFDGGAKHGKASAMGAGLCLQTAGGDLFALRQIWRPYLNGDGEWAWLNNGENQWFSPHPAGLPREDGWNRWTFDFSDPQATVVERDGKRIDAKRMPPGRFVPAHGGVGLEFFGPADAKDEPLWIDDLTLILPAKR